MMKPCASPRERAHRGDIMSAATRSRVMARIKGKDTGPERAALALMMAEGITPELQARDLAGRPDFVLRQHRIAIFIDGGFWHGWRFPTWRHKLSEVWEAKIEANRKRDRRNHARLRRAGWKVIRIWDFQLERSPEACLQRIVDAVNECERDAETSYKDKTGGSQ